jgi:uncharacterized membrane protein YdbT with pleckstrin-like domain
MPTTVDHDGYLRKVLAHEERLLFVVRVHGIFLFFRLFWWLLLFVVVFGFTATMVATQGQRFVLVSILLLVPTIPLWWIYQVWTNHKFVVTTRRVLQIKGVLGKHVVDASLDQINDVKTDQSVFGRMLDYGTVEVVTASDLLTDEMVHIARPLEFKRVLMDAKEALVHPKPAPAPAAE